MVKALALLAALAAVSKAAPSLAQEDELKQVEATVSQGGVLLHEEARAGKILRELRAAEGLAAKELKGHPEILRQEESLLHQAAKRAGEARVAFRKERKHAALLAGSRKVAAKSATGSEAQTASSALLNLASGLQAVAKDDASVLKETDQVARFAEQQLGDSATARRVEALMSKAEVFERKVMHSDEHAVKEARQEAHKLARGPVHGAIKFNSNAEEQKMSKTENGLEVGSDEDIHAEVGKLMAETEAMDERKEEYEKIHGQGTFKARALSQKEAKRRREQAAQSRRKLAMTAHVVKATEGSQIGSDADLHSEVKKLLAEAELDQSRVTLRQKTEATIASAEKKQLGLQKQLGRKHRVHGNASPTKSFKQLSDERRLEARRSRQHAPHERAQAEEKEQSRESRDSHLMQELAAVRRSVVRSLRDGSKMDDAAADTENHLIREAERVLQEADRAREGQLPAVALQQHSSRMSKAHEQHKEAAAIAKRGQALALKASNAAVQEARAESKILHETKFAEDQVGKLLSGAGAGAEKVREQVMKDLEKAQRAEKKALRAELSEAHSAERAAGHLAKQAKKA